MAAGEVKYAYTWFEVVLCYVHVAFMFVRIDVIRYYHQKVLLPISRLYRVVDMGIQ